VKFDADIPSTLHFPASQTVDLLKQMMPELRSAFSVAIHQPRSKTHRLGSVGDSARPRLQEPNQGRVRAAAACRGVLISE